MCHNALHLHFRVHKLCTELVETIFKTRDRIVKKIETEKVKADAACEVYTNAVKVMQDPIKLCLLGGQILPCITSPIDVLNIAPVFFLRVEVFYITFVIKSGLEAHWQKSGCHAKSTVQFNYLRRTFGVSESLGAISWY